MSHALLSPSAASRWLTCTPSARLEERFPDKETTYAEEGSLAHELGELALRRLNGEINQEALDGRMERLAAHPMYSEEMYGYAGDYAAFVWEKFSAARAASAFAVLRVEEKIDLTAYVPEGFGTGDAVIIADGTLEIVDLKYGKGVPVRAEWNKQMMLYALGALDMFGYLYAIDRVRMTIYQPRLGNVSEFELPVADLLNWGVDELRPRAAMAFRGEGELRAGDHCRFCRAKAECRALAEYNLSLDRYAFQEADLLKEDEVADILRRAEGFKTWIAAVEEHALRKALEGTRYPGFKIVEGRSVRRYADEGKVAEALVRGGFSEEQLYERKLKTITQLEKLCTKKAFTALVGGLIIKPEGKPTLVPVEDKRPEFNSAADDFKDIQV